MVHCHIKAAAVTFFSSYFVLVLGPQDRIWTPSLEEDGPEKQVQDRLQLWQTYSQHDSCKHDNGGREPELRDKDVHGNDITAKREVCIGPTLRKQMELSSLFTRLACVWLMYEAAANAPPESTIPSLTCAASGGGPGLFHRQMAPSWTKTQSIIYNGAASFSFSFLVHLQAASPSAFHRGLVKRTKGRKATSINTRSCDQRKRAVC